MSKVLKMRIRLLKIHFLILLLFSCKQLVAGQVRIKDIASVKGNRSNHLIGIGLVIGLQGTGDSPASLATNVAVSNLVTRLGIGIQPENIPTASVAAVILTAELPAFSRNGSRIPVKASVIGDATSLAGGTLLPSRLKAGDGKVYVVASGSILTGQANGVGVKTLTSAILPQSGVVEREFSPDLVRENSVSLLLDNSDFSTSARVAEAINRYFRGFYASSPDPHAVTVLIPPSFRTRIVEFLAEVESIRVSKDAKAVVIINEKTGTVVIGSEVTILPVVISHGDLSIQVGEGDSLKENSLTEVSGATVGDLLKSLNSLGLKPEDLVSIMQGIYASGSLNADFKVM